ncbi:hypothetical protein P7C71_g4102, partial [Lecanoromycetidae sp. Uapishka_2]
MNDELGANPFRVGGHRWVGVAERRKLEEDQAECDRLERTRVEKAQVLQDERQRRDVERLREEFLQKQQRKKERIEKERADREQAEERRLQKAKREREQAKQQQLEKKRLEVEKRKFPQPFYQTRLGNLPGEIRTLIYEHVLTVPPPYIVTKMGVVSPEPDSAVTPEDILSTTLFLSDRPKDLLPTTMLKVCRQINREAYHIFYERNIFSFATAPELHAFLSRIGPLRRQELRTLYIEKLLCRIPIWTESQLNHMSAQGQITDVEREEYARATHLNLGPEALEACTLLKDCKQLAKAVLTFESEYNAFAHIQFILSIFENTKTGIDFLNGSHWAVVEVDDTHYWYSALFAQLEERGAYNKLFGKAHHQVEVDFRKKIPQVEADSVRERSHRLFK